MIAKIFARVLNASYPSFDAVFNARWHKNPFTECPRGTKEQYAELAAEASLRQVEQVKEYSKRVGFLLDSHWLLKLALHTQIVLKKSTLCYSHGPLLYAVLRDKIRRDGLRYVNILETGTARGFSSLCMAKALSDAGVEGKIVTFDVIPHMTEMFWNCIDDFDGKQTRQSLLKNYEELIERYLIFVQGDTRVSLPKTFMSRVHLAFLDGAHTYEDVWGEYSYLKAKQRAGDIIVYDDYNAQEFPGIVQAVDEICAKEGYDQSTIGLGGAGRAYVVACKK